MKNEFGLDSLSTGFCEKVKIIIRNKTYPEVALKIKRTTNKRTLYLYRYQRQKYRHKTFHHWKLFREGISVYHICYVYAWIYRWVIVIIVQIKLMVRYFYFLVMKVFFLSKTEKIAYFEILKLINGTKQLLVRIKVLCHSCPPPSNGGTGVESLKLSQKRWVQIFSIKTGVGKIGGIV